MRRAALAFFLVCIVLASAAMADGEASSPAMTWPGACGLTALDGGRLIVPTLADGDAYIDCVSADGGLLWRAELPNTPVRKRQTNLSPVDAGFLEMSFDRGSQQRERITLLSADFEEIWTFQDGKDGIAYFYAQEAVGGYLVSGSIYRAEGQMIVNLDGDGAFAGATALENAVDATYLTACGDAWFVWVLEENGGVAMVLLDGTGMEVSRTRWADRTLGRYEMTVAADGGLWASGPAMDEASAWLGWNSH